MTSTSNLKNASLHRSSTFEWSAAEGGPYSIAKVWPEVIGISIMVKLHLSFEGENPPGQMLAHRPCLPTEGNTDKNPTLSTLYYDFLFLSLYTFRLSCSWCVQRYIHVDEAKIWPKWASL